MSGLAWPMPDNTGVHVDSARQRRTTPDGSARAGCRRSRDPYRRARPDRQRLSRTPETYGAKSGCGRSGSHRPSSVQSRHDKAMWSGITSGITPACSAHPGTAPATAAPTATVLTATAPTTTRGPQRGKRRTTTSSASAGCQPFGYGPSASPSPAGRTPPALLRHRNPGNRPVSRSFRTRCCPGRCCPTGTRRGRSP